MKYTGKKRIQNKYSFLAGITTGLLTASLIAIPVVSPSTTSAASLSTDSATLLSTDSAAPLSEEDATQIALDAAGLQEADVTIHIQRDTDDGLDLYKLKLFTDTQEEYEYEILAETGEILEASWEQWGTADGKGTAISLDDAKQLAADHAGIALEDAIFEKAEEDREGGERIWDLEFFTENQKEYEYEITCDTGLILSWSYDGERYLAWKAANPDATQAQENLQSMGLAQDNTQSSDNSSVYYDGHHPEAHHTETHH